MCWQVSTHFSYDPRSPGQMRRFATARLSGLLASRPERRELLGDVTLIVSELVTNSINARCTSGTVDLSWHRDQLRIEVWDDAAGWPTLQAAGRDESHGRGLAITSALTTAWGVETTKPGKRVWAELPVPTTLTGTLHCDR